VFLAYFLNTSIGPIGPAPDGRSQGGKTYPLFLAAFTITSYTNVAVQATVVPEPGNYLLLGAGLLLVARPLGRKMLRSPARFGSVTGEKLSGQPAGPYTSEPRTAIYVRSRTPMPGQPLPLMEIA
jgi:hypothetical protein